MNSRIKENLSLSVLENNESVKTDKEASLDRDRNRLFLKPLKQYLEVIEQTNSNVIKHSENETSKLCLSKNPIAVMNVWETLIEAHKNTEFLKFMITQARTESDIFGEITGWNCYKHKGHTTQQTINGDISETRERLIYMPETKFTDQYNGKPKESLGHLNPYRCFKTSHSTVARTMRNIERLDLEFVYSFVLTLPGEVSKLYLETSRPIEIDFRVNRCVKEFSKLLRVLFGGQIAMAVNKHVWSSMNPLKPHAHAHILLLDRIILKDRSEKQIIPSWFMEYDNRTKRYAEGSLTRIIKHEWAKIVNKEFKDLEINYSELETKFEFIELKRKNGQENISGHRKLIHKLKYNRRRPLADLALYYLFNDFNCLDVDDVFAEHLITYKNSTQIFGYWNRMSHYAKRPLEDLKPGEALCPFCNETLLYDSFHDSKELPKNVLKVFIDRRGMAWSVRGDG